MQRETVKSRAASITTCMFRNTVELYRLIQKGIAVDQEYQAFAYHVLHTQ